MQDPATAAAFPQLSTQFPEHEQLRCPRCDSSNTKFCYYNNYNLSQPRHFCKNCRRYWTKGGTLRNIPVGGGTRKNSSKRSSAASKQQQQRPVQNTPTSLITPLGSGSYPSQSLDQNPSLKAEPVPIPVSSFGVGTGSGVQTGSFTSLLGLASNGQFGNLLDGLSHNGLKTGSSNGLGQNLGLELLHGNGSSSEGYSMLSGLQHRSEPNCWGNTNGWPDLAIDTPGSKFQ